MFYSNPTTSASNTMPYTPTPSSLSSNTTNSSSRNNSIASMSSSTDPRTIALGFSPSSSDAMDIFQHSRSNSYSTTSRCAYPSWPSGVALVRNPSTSSTYSTPSAYVSDEDLFGDDDEPYLSEPPPPPRSAEVWLAKPLLPPVIETKPRRSSVHFSKSKKHHSSTHASSATKRKE